MLDMSSRSPSQPAGQPTPTRRLSASSPARPATATGGLWDLRRCVLTSPSSRSTSASGCARFGPRAAATSTNSSGRRHDGRNDPREASPAHPTHRGSCRTQCPARISHHQRRHTRRRRAPVRRADGRQERRRHSAVALQRDADLADGVRHRRALHPGARDAGDDLVRRRSDPRVTSHLGHLPVRRHRHLRRHHPHPPAVRHRRVLPLRPGRREARGRRRDRSVGSTERCRPPARSTNSPTAARRPSSRRSDTDCRRSTRS
jgi:hypothetical protein